MVYGGFIAYLLAWFVAVVNMIASCGGRSVPAGTHRGGLARAVRHLGVRRQPTLAGSSRRLIPVAGLPPTLPEGVSPAR